MVEGTKEAVIFWQKANFCQKIVQQSLYEHRAFHFQSTCELWPYTTQ